MGQGTEDSLLCMCDVLHLKGQYREIFLLECFRRSTLYGAHISRLKNDFDFYFVFEVIRIFREFPAVASRFPRCPRCSLQRQFFRIINHIYFLVKNLEEGEVEV
jgi:hypothetical protein